MTTTASPVPPALAARTPTARLSWSSLLSTVAPVTILDVELPEFRRSARRQIFSAVSLYPPTGSSTPRYRQAD